MLFLHFSRSDMVNTCDHISGLWRSASSMVVNILLKKKFALKFGCISCGFRSLSKNMREVMRVVYSQIFEEIENKLCDNHSLLTTY